MIQIKLFLIFFKIGIFTFGGGYAMLPLIQNEMIKQGWITLDQFIDIIAVSQMTPGSIAINNATFVGYKVGGVLGIIASTFGLIAPSLIIITLILKLLDKYKDNPLLEGAWTAIRPAVVGLIFIAVVSIGQEALVESYNWIIAILSLVLVAKFKMHPIGVILIAGLLGLLGGFI